LSRLKKEKWLNKKFEPISGSKQRNGTKYFEPEKYFEPGKNVMLRDKKYWAWSQKKKIFLSQKKIFF
jgi:hypothetical protein